LFAPPWVPVKVHVVPEQDICPTTLPFPKIKDRSRMVEVKVKSEVPKAFGVRDER
jgi:hypothetical protein